MMRERLEEYAPYISWFGLFLILAGLLLPLLLPADSSAQMPAQMPWALIIVGVLLFLVWPLARPGDLRAALGSRRTRFGGNALILMLSVIGVLVVVNYLANLRYAIVDVTANRQYSISRQTAQILDDLDDQDEVLQLTAVMSSQDRVTVEDLEQLVDKYRARTSRIEYRQIDPDIEPLAAFEVANRIGEDPTSLRRLLVAEMGGEHELVYSGFDEQAVTEAIVKVMDPGKRSVLFTTGHGEFSPDGGERSYAQVRTQLEREGYDVDTVNLKTVTETLSADTVDAVIVAGPQGPFLPEEADQLSTYLDDGGAVMLLLDSPLFGAEASGLEAVMRPWDIGLSDDIVLQQNVMGQLSPTVVAGGDAYNYHTITKDLTELGIDTVYPGTRSLTVGTPVTTSLLTTALVEVDGAVWGETDFGALEQQQAEPNEAEDNMPPLPLAVAAEDTTEEGGMGRLVVIGTSGLVADEVLGQFLPGQFANFDLFLNAVNWLAQEEALISIRPTEPDDRPLERLDARGQYLMLLTMVVLAPLVVLSVGAWIYWRRR